MNKKKKIILLIISILLILNITIMIDYQKSGKRRFDFEIKNFFIKLKEDNLEKDNIDILLKDYPQFLEIIKSAHIKIPILESLVPQGITMMGKNILISAYDFNMAKSSVIFVLNESGNVLNIISLNNKSHVGSIYYDEKREFLWIPDDNGILNVYEAKDFLSKKNLNPIYQFKNISTGLLNYLDKKKNEIAYFTIYNDMLYIGSFSNHGKGKIKKYQIIESEEGLQLIFKKDYLSPILVQGMTFYNYNNEDYLILSSSYGQKNDSHLEIYQFVDSKKDITKMPRQKLTLPPMVEQITIFNDSLYILFESSASNYSDTLTKIEYICELNIEDLIRNFNESLKN